MLQVESDRNIYLFSISFPGKRGEKRTLKERRRRKEKDSEMRPVKMTSTALIGIENPVVPRKFSVTNRPTLNKIGGTFSNVRGSRVITKDRTITDNKDSREKGTINVLKKGNFVCFDLTVELLLIS